MPRFRADRRSAPRALCFLVALAALVLAPPLRAQQISGGAPGAEGHPFRPPLASPLEPATRLVPIRVERGDRERWVADLDLGERFPFPLIRPDGSGGFALSGAVAAGVSSRFDLEGNGNEFIQAHYRIGARLRAAVAGIALRGELYHVSSHLGDEFLERTGRDPISTSREGVEFLAQLAPLPGLLVYGGPGFLLRSTEDFDSPSIRSGAEWRPIGEIGPFRPLLSGEIFAWDELDWDPRVSGQAGLETRRGTVSLAAVVGAGPSRAEQFFREDETLWGLALTVRP